MENNCDSEKDTLDKDVCETAEEELARSSLKEIQAFNSYDDTRALRVLRRVMENTRSFRNNSNNNDTEADDNAANTDDNAANTDDNAANTDDNAANTDDNQHYCVCLGDLLAQNGYAEHLIKVLEHFHSVGFTKVEEVWNTVEAIFMNIIYFSSASKKFAKVVSLSFMTKLLIEASKNHENCSEDKHSDDGLVYCLRTLHCLLHQHLCSKSPSSDRSALLAAAKQSLKRDDKYVKLWSIVVTAQLLTTDNDINEISEQYEVIATIDTYLATLLIHDTEPSVVSSRNEDSALLDDVMSALTIFSATNANKVKIIERGMLSHLEKLMTSRLPSHQRHAVLVVWSLARDKPARRRIKEHEGECMTLVEQLANHERGDIKLPASGALWYLQGKLEKKKEGDSTQDVDPNKKYVFISYAAEDTELCLKVKEILEEASISVTLSDYSRTIDETDEAIRGASCVLFCISESYKLDPLCRLESDYAMKLSKKFGICRMSSYKTEGTLLETIGRGDPFDLTDEDELKEKFKHLLVCVKRCLDADQKSSTIRTGSDTLDEMLQKLVGSLRQALHSDSDSDSDREGSVNSGTLRPDLTDEKLQDFIKTAVKDIAEFSGDFTKPAAARIVRYVGQVPDQYPNTEAWEETVTQLKLPELTGKIIKQLFGGGDINDKKRFNAIKCVLNAVFNYTEVSEKFANAFAGTGAIYFLNEASLLNKAFLKDQDDEKVGTVTLSTLCVLYNVSLYKHNIPTLKRENTLKALQPFLDSKVNQWKVIATLTTAALMLHDLETEVPASLISGAFLILNFLSQALEAPNRKYRGFCPKELAVGIKNISSRDEHGRLLLDAGILPSLTKLLKSDTRAEQLVAAHVMWYLSFDQTNRTKISHEADCLEALRSLTFSSDLDLRDSVQNALCLYDEQLEFETELNEQYGELVMSCCQQDNLDFIKTIESRLQQDGMKVWRSTSMTDNKDYVQTMTQAVNQCDTVVVCVSRNYRLDMRCRTELEFAQKHNKEIIPVLIDSSYQPEGWILESLGSNIYISFTKSKQFDQVYQILYTELKAKSISSSPDASSSPTASSTDPRPAATGVDLHKPVHEWSVVDVLYWMDVNALKSMKRALIGCNGKNILDLAITAKHAPEYFCTAFNKEHQLNCMETAAMFAALRKVEEQHQEHNSKTSQV